eukprot:2979881-Alexandrium_andersonii.AAC.1
MASLRGWQCCATSAWTPLRVAASRRASRGSLSVVRFGPPSWAGGVTRWACAAQASRTSWCSGASGAA